MFRADDEPVSILAVAYVRMSTEHQQYSTSNQLDVIKEYAARRGMSIVKVYSDEGKSGLNIQGRDSLAQMIEDVQRGDTHVSSILVYDVSRWGRFQDADESAYYEYICRRTGVGVHYCAEQFENDGSPVSTIVKGVKRAMAGEYSRELSSKVFHGACNLIQRGFKQGGTAGYGLRRVLVDQCGQQKATLKMGEQKSLQTDRVILVPGPEEEVKTVRWIYEAFLSEGKSESEIAALLNDRAVLTDFGRAWTRGVVHQILTNEKYVGNNVYHRTSFKLKRKHVAIASRDNETDLLLVNNELRVSIVLCRHTSTDAGASRWLVRLDAGLKPDITIAVRMDSLNEKIRDYYLLPGIDMTWESLRIAEENGVYLDAYRFETLDLFFEMTKRIKIQEAA